MKREWTLSRMILAKMTLKTVLQPQQGGEDILVDWIREKEAGLGPPMTPWVMKVSLDCEIHIRHFPPLLRRPPGRRQPRDIGGFPRYSLRSGVVAHPSGLDRSRKFQQVDQPA
jgi:hypothetical protein